MRVDFTKMHGLGNDFVVLDARACPLPVDAALARALADRRTGIGCDQVIVLVPSTIAELGMRIFNADGGEVESCGNASRAVTLLLDRSVRIETLGGIISGEPEAGGAAIDMGKPRCEWHEVPLAYAMDTLAMPVAWEDLAGPCAVNVGNPHVVFFVPDCDTVEIERLGPVIEHDSLFPERVNVNFATIEGPRSIRLRVWERGAGLTRACGTGACATTVAAIRRGLLCEREASVKLPGGELHIAWPRSGTVRMRGAASESFRGSFALSDYAGVA